MPRAPGLVGVRGRGVFPLLFDLNRSPRASPALAPSVDVQGAPTLRDRLTFASSPWRASAPARAPTEVSLCFPGDWPRGRQLKRPLPGAAHPRLSQSV